MTHWHRTCVHHMDCCVVLVYPLVLERTLESERKPPALWLLNHRGSSCWYWILVTFRAFVCAVSKWREIRSGSGRPKGGLLLESIKEMCDHACLTKPFCVWLVRWRGYYEDKALGGWKCCHQQQYWKKTAAQLPLEVVCDEKQYLLVKTAVAAQY